MSYVVCTMISDDADAYVADGEELAEVAWVKREDLPTHVPYGLFEPVQKYLDEHLNVAGTD